MDKLLKLLVFLFASGIHAENDSNIQVANFSSGNMAGWEEKTFSGSTSYQLTWLNNIQVLKAESHATASGLFKRQRVDLMKTPFLNWQWRIDNRLQNNNEQSKSGDDYSARIYVVISAGWAFWRTRAINYVWTNHTVRGGVWPNAFAGRNAMMIAIRSKADKTHTWYQEKRNILQDLKKQFGTDIHNIDAIAIMTDTDNAQGNAIAYYGDIFFSKQ